MGNSQQFHSDSNLGDKKEETVFSKDVENIMELYNLLSLEDRLIVKRLIINKKLF